MRRACLILLGLLAIGCVSLKVQRLDEVVRPVQPPDSVVVLLEEPDRPYTVIAVVESSYEGSLKGFDDLREKMVAEAAELGGDALVLGPESRKTGVMFVGAPVPSPIFFDRKTLTGEVIQFD